MLLFNLYESVSFALFSLHRGREKLSTLKTLKRQRSQINGHHVENRHTMKKKKKFFSTSDFPENIFLFHLSFTDINFQYLFLAHFHHSYSVH